MRLTVRGWALFLGLAFLLGLSPWPWDALPWATPLPDPVYSIDAP